MVNQDSSRISNIFSMTMQIGYFNFKEQNKKQPVIDSEILRLLA